MRNRIKKYINYVQYCEYKIFRQILKEYNGLDNFIISVINSTVRATKANKNGYGVQVDYLKIYKQFLWKKTCLSKWHLTYLAKK
jgi:hypothetical protein